MAWRMRAMGLEQELGLQRESAVEQDLAQEVLSGLPSAWTDEHGVMGFPGVWMPNGSRAYIDMFCPDTLGERKGILEIATAECAHLEDLLAVNEANERMVAASAAARGVRVYKLNQDWSSDFSRGTHENYQLRRDEAGEYLSSEAQTTLWMVNQALLPYLVTRIIYTGSGGIGWDGACGKYLLSQRAPAIVQDSTHNIATESRGIANVRTISHAGMHSMRLHVITGDANRSQRATAMKFGGMALMIGLIQEGLLPDLELSDPVRALHAVNADLTGKAPCVQRNDGSWCSALEIQEMYLERMLRLRERWGQGPYDGALDLITQALGLLRERDAVELVGHCDHALKHVLLQRFVYTKGYPVNHPRARAVHLGYQQLGQGNLFDTVARSVGHAPLVTEGLVQRYMGASAHAPATRARVRVQLLRDHANDPQMIVYWDELQAGGRRFVLEDPLDTRCRTPSRDL